MVRWPYVDVRYHVCGLTDNGGKRNSLPWRYTYTWTLWRYIHTWPYTCLGATLTLAHTSTLDVEKKKDNALKTMRIICTHTAQSQRPRAEKQCNPSHRDWTEIHSYWRSWAPSSKAISKDRLSFWSLAKSNSPPDFGKTRIRSQGLMPIAHVRLGAINQICPKPLST